LANIELNVVALGDFKGLESQLGALQTQINAMNAELASGAASLTAKQMSGLSNAFNQSILSSGQFTSKLVSMSTAAQHLGERLQKSHTTMTDYRSAMKKVSDQSNIYNQLAQRQVGMQQAIVQSMGGGMARVFAQHNVDLTQASIRSKVFTEAIIAQKTALMQGATGIINWGKNMQWAGRQLTAGLTMPVALFAAGIAKMYNEVDMNLTRLARVYGVGLEKPTKATLDAVRKDVIGLSKELGHELGISAAEVSDTAAQFAAAGLTGKELIGATEQASRMVVLGEVDKQKAITATIALQTAYKLNTQEVTEATNFFNAAQAATSTSMADLVDAIPTVGPVIRGLGGSYKDMVAILTAMKEGGVPASEAANAIKNSMGRIINPTKAAQDTLKGFGIDINGIVNNNAGDLIGTLTALQTNLDKLSSLDRQKAISELFGKFQFARMAAFMDNFNRTGTQSAKVVEMMGMSAAELASIADEQTKKIQQSASGRFKIAIQDLKNSLLPIGEATLNMFSKIVEGITNFADKISNLPGPIKTFLKIFSGLAIVTGPVIMLVGLFGNLMGQVAKGLVNIRTFGAALMNIQNGVNPLTILGKKFNMVTEEMLAETEAAKIFGNTMEANVSPITAVTAAIEELIAAMKQLGTTSLVASTQKIQTQAASMGGAAAIAFGAGGGNFTGVNRSHYVPFTQMTPSGYNAETYGNQQTAVSPGDKSRIREITTTGVSILPGGVGDKMNSALKARQAIIYKGYEDIAKATQDDLKLKLEGLFTQEEINQALVSQFKTEEQVVEIESGNKAARIIMADKNSQLATIISQRIESARNELSSAQTLNERMLVTSTLQQDINAILSNDAEYLSLKESLMQEFNAALSQAVTLEEKENVVRSMLSKYLVEEVDEVVTYKEVSKLNVGQTQRMQQSLRAAAEAAAGLPGAVQALESALIEETIETKKIIPAGTPSIPSTGGRFKNAISGGGLAMGVGMGASMAGGMMMGSENKTVANAGSGLMYGGMAASMAPMLGMTGPQGLALGAVIALTVAMKKAYDESERLRKGLLQTFSISDVAAEQFGITIRNLSDVQLAHLIGTSQQAKDTVSQLAEAYSNATGKTKDYIDSIKNMTNASDISNVMITKFYTDLASGLNPEQAKQDIAAILKDAGKEDYSIDIRLKIDKIAFAGGPADAFKQSISDITSNQDFAKIKPLQDQQAALRQQLANDPMNAVLAQQISAISDQILNLSVGVVKDSEKLSTAITNAFNTMSVKDFRESITGIGPAFTENEPAIQSFINTMAQTNPQIAGIMKELHNEGAAWADVLTAAQLVAEGTITSIEEMRLAAKMPIILDYYMNVHETKIEQTIMDNQKKNIAGSLKGSLPGSSSGGSGNGNKAIDAEIEKNKELIDLIKKQMEERKKALDLAQREADFAKTKMSLENQIRDALAEGNFLKAAELQQQLKVEESKKSEEDNQRALDAADQKRIDDLEAKNKELEKKKGKGGSGSSASSSSGKSGNGSTITSVTDALDAFSQKMSGSTLDQFLNTPEVKSYIDQLVKLGVPYDDARKAAIKYHDVARTNLFAIAGDYETAHKEVFDKLTLVSTEFAGKSTEAKDSIQQDIESIVLNPAFDNHTKIDELSKYLVTSLKMGPDEAKAAAQDFLNSFSGKVNLDALAAIENGYTNISDAARAALLKQRAVALLARNKELTPDQAMQQALAESREHGGKATGGIMRYSEAGSVKGPGGGTADMIPAMLSNGEYVIRASSVSKYGKQVLDQINNGVFNIDKPMSPTFNMPGLPTNASSASSTNNATINAEFHISGGDAKEIAQEVMNKLKISMKKSGSVNRF
jgi:TP901 family phage tail tape measure protein